MENLFQVGEVISANESFGPRALNQSVREIIPMNHGTMYDLGNCYVHVSNDIDTSKTVQLYEYFYGDGKLNQGRLDVMIDYINSSPDSLQGVTIINKGLSQVETTQFHDTIEAFKSAFADKLGIQYNNSTYTTTTAGWSSGVFASVKEASRSDARAAIMYDSLRQSAYQSSVNQLTTQEMDRLKENGTVIYSVEGSSNARTHLHFEEFYVKERGIPVVVVQPVRGDGNELEHWEVQDWAYKSGLNEFAAGKRSTLKIVYDQKGLEYTVNYSKPVVTTNANGEKEISYVPITEEEAFKIGGGFAAGVKNNAQSTKEPTKDTSKPSSDVVSANYAFTEAFVSAMFSNISNTKIMNSSNIQMNSSGAQTFRAANNVYNNYANNSRAFFASLNTACGNILTAAAAWENLDKQLANGTAAFNDLTSLNLSTFDTFYSQTPNIGNIDLSGNGNVKVTIEELFEACSDSNIIMSSLLQDVSDTQNIKVKLDEFIDNSKGQLTGESWDAIRGKMIEFSEVCTKKNEYATKMIDSMQNAYKKLIEHLQAYDLSEADTSKIGEFETNLKQMKSHKESLLTALASLQAEHGKSVCDGWDDKGNCISHYTIDNSAKIAACQTQIEDCDKVITELTKVIEGLYKLFDVDKNAASDIVGANSNMGGYVGSPSVNSMQMPTIGVTQTVEDLNKPLVPEVSKPVVEEVKKPVIENVSSPSVESKPTYGNNTNNSNSYTEEKDNNIEEDIDVDTSTEDMEIEDNYEVENDEDTLIPDMEDSEVEENIMDNSQIDMEVEKDRDGNILKTLGVTAAVGGAIGVAGYGTKKYMDSKKNDSFDEEDNEEEMDEFDE